MHCTLTESCDYAPQHTLLLKLDRDDLQKPSDVLEEIRRVVDGLLPGDTVLFYFAGHGHYFESRTYLILPTTIPGAYESTALGLDDISKELRPPQRSGFRIFDACHSGLDVRNGIGKPDSSSFVRAITDGPSSGWVTLAACREDQFSVMDPQIGHGVFTYYLCDYILGLKPNEPVYPEMLKVSISDQVGKHAKRLGNIQTPTLNASISGNISLASRRVDIYPPEVAIASPDPKQNLHARIAKLREVPKMFEKGYLQEVLAHLVTSVSDELVARNKLSPGPLVTKPPMRAEEIPSWMNADVVTFALQQGFQSRHGLVRWQEELRYPLIGATSLLNQFYPKEKVVHYDVWQPGDLPESAAILELPGDGRCVPEMAVLLYVLPLQLTTCLLVSAFRREWPPHDERFELLCHSHQIEKPGVTVDHASELSPFAIKRIIERLHKVVTNRVDQLEKEMKQ